MELESVSGRVVLALCEVGFDKVGCSRWVTVCGGAAVVSNWCSDIDVDKWWFATSDGCGGVSWEWSSCESDEVIIVWGSGTLGETEWSRDSLLSRS